MPRSSQASFRSPSSDLRLVRDGCRDALIESGLAFRLDRLAEDSFTLSGSSNRWLSIAQSLVPFLDAFGPFSRVAATIKATRFGEDLRLHLRVYPCTELDEVEERFLFTQGPIEAIGDHWRSRRIFRKLVRALEQRDLITTEELEQAAAPATTAEPSR